MLGKIGDLSFITHAAFQCTLINKGTQSFVFQKCDEMPEGKPQIYIQRARSNTVERIFNS